MGFKYYIYLFNLFECKLSTINWVLISLQKNNKIFLKKSKRFVVKILNAAHLIVLIIFMA